MEIKNKVFAISGTSSGLGKATADMILNHEGYVIGLDLRTKENNISDLSHHQNIRIFSCDVRSDDAVQKSLEAGCQHFGAIHGAIACAGVAPARTMYSSKKGSHSLKEFMDVLEINLGGTFNLFNQCIPYLRKNDPGKDDERGVLIATSSVAAMEGQVGQVAYAASKGGVSAMILPMARELARSGIRVNAIAPGIFSTPMVAGFPEEVQQSLADYIPFPKRLGEAGEFADLVRSIIQNRYLNGAVYRLDGGVRMP